MMFSMQNIFSVNATLFFAAKTKPHHLDLLLEQTTQAVINETYPSLFDQFSEICLHDCC